jgi:WD40 repeat protein
MYHLKLKFVILISLCVLSYTWCEKSHFYESDQVNEVDISPDGTMIATVSDSRKAIVWNFKTMQPIFNFTCSNGEEMNTVKFSKDQRFLAAGDSDGKIYIYRITAPSTFSLVTSGTGVGVGDFS